MLKLRVDIQHADIVEFIKSYLELDRPKEKIGRLAREFDWNPFNEDDDEHKGVFGEVHHNMVLISDAAVAVVQTIQIAVAGVVEDLDDPDKHAIAKAVIDDAIRLPWYAEFLDGPVIDLVLTMAVRTAKMLDWGALTPGELEAVTQPDGTYDVSKLTQSIPEPALHSSVIRQRIAMDGRDGIEKKLLASKKTRADRTLEDMLRDQGR